MERMGLGGRDREENVAGPLQGMGRLLHHIPNVVRLGSLGEPGRHHLSFVIPTMR